MCLHISKTKGKRIEKAEDFRGKKSLGKTTIEKKKIRKSKNE